MVLGFGFASMGLNRIEATVTPGNEGSLRVLQKLGFKREGLLRQHKKIHNQYTDAIVLSLLSSEYLSF